MITRLKSILHQKCLEFVEQRISNLQQAIEFSRESANDETKSSSGDKHETGRAMGQLEQEKNTKQLSEALELKQTLLKINPDLISQNVGLGSLVITSHGSFYISIAAGKITSDNKTYYAVSPASPIGLKLMGVSVNKEISFNNQLYKIIEII